MKNTLQVLTKTEAQLVNGGFALPDFNGPMAPAKINVTRGILGDFIVENLPEPIDPIHHQPVEPPPTPISDVA